MVLDVKVKKLYPDAKLPVYLTEGSACFDLPFCESSPEGSVDTAENKEGNTLWAAVTLPTGLAFEIPDGHVMFIFPRSGLAFNKAITLANCVGVIDPDYRGEVKVKLVPNGGENTKKLIAFIKELKNGARIAQALVLPYPRVAFKQVEELSVTERGFGGFGSTGG